MSTLDDQVEPPEPTPEEEIAYLRKRNDELLSQVSEYSHYAEIGGVLEQVLDDIIKHDEDHPDHGIGCACHDNHARRIRALMVEKGVGPMSAIDTNSARWKSLSNFLTVLKYVTRNP